MSFSETSYSEKLYTEMLNSLNRQVYKPGQVLPSLRVLAQKSKVSVGVVRHVFSRLQNENRLVSRHGKGFYVSVDREQSIRKVLLLARFKEHLHGDFITAFQREFVTYNDCYLIPENIEDHDNKGTLGLEKRIDKLVKNGLDAVFFLGVGTEKLKFLKKYSGNVNIYCYMSSPTFSGLDCSQIISDWYHGAYCGLRHLADIGCKKILFVTHRGCHTALLDGVEAIKREFADKISIQVYQEFTASPNDMFIDHIQEYIANIDAIFSMGDYRLVKICDWLKTNGYKIPEDIAILGYYNTPWCTELTPQLSSVDIQPQQIAQTVCDLFFNSKTGTKIIHPKVVVRASTSL